MSYDSSITKRKGCNYCLRGKQIPETGGENGFRWYINDSKRLLQADNDNISEEEILIFYCPICGKQLT